VKSWATDIQNHIQTYSAKLGNLGWWPTYIYHYTDVNNAANIIRDGYVYSRNEAKRQGVMQIDNASPDVIEQTHPDCMDYVRCITSITSG
jgi:hypothetical protein